MTQRRALVLIIVIGAAAMVFAATQYARDMMAHSATASTASSTSSSPADDSSGGGPITLRFYKNPATMSDFTIRDLDGVAARQGDARQFLGDMVRSLPCGDSRPRRAPAEVPRSTADPRHLRRR